MRDSWFDADCAECGKPTKVPFDPAKSRSPAYCKEHLLKRGGNAGNPPSMSRPSLPSNYLEKGYFGESGELLPELVTSHAEQVAKALGQAGVTNSLLYRFFSTARNTQQEMDTSAQGGHARSFDDIISSILALQPMAASIVGRAKARNSNEGERLETFKEFIDRNAQLAVTNEVMFRKGFLKHFEYVIAYFKYHSPKK